MKKFKISYLLFVFLLFSKINVFAVYQDKTICLNMIVRNESDVILRALTSVKDIIDYWVIVDTGSHDGTQDLILEFFKDKPGELHEREWVNFEHNRNEALKLAKNKTDYILFIDADEEIVLTKPFNKNLLNKDFYSFIVKEPGRETAFHRTLLVNGCFDWRWSGVLHEDLTCKDIKSYAVFDFGYVLAHPDGHRSKNPDKYLLDAKLLEEALEKDPSNSRYMYYLAQSYLNVPDFDKALYYYKKRTQMQGCDQELFYSYYNIANLQKQLGFPDSDVLNSYLVAFENRSSRAEPLFQIANYYLTISNYFYGYLVSKHALTIPLSDDAMYVDRWIYDWGILLQFAQCAFHLGYEKEAKEAIEKLIQKEDLPEEIRQGMQKKLLML